MVACLSAVCLICSGLLGAAFALTKEPIEEAAKAKTTAAIAQVLPAFDCELGDVLYVTSEGVLYSYYEVPGVGYAVISSTGGFGGELKLMVGVTNDGCVHNVVVLSHSETPGLGAKCQSDDAFVAQFRGLDPAVKRLEVSKDGGDIDAITASTITSRAYTAAVKNAVKLAKDLASGELTGSIGLTENKESETASDDCGSGLGILAPEQGDCASCGACGHH